MNAKHPLRLARVWGIHAILAWLAVGVTLTARTNDRDLTPLFPINITLALASGVYSGGEALRATAREARVWAVLGLLPVVAIMAGAVVLLASMVLR